MEAKMESLYEITTQLDEQGILWKNLQTKCLQEFAAVH